MGYTKGMNTRGFTLVDLLIVIVVIVILAAITVVSYGTWRTRTAQTEVQADLKQASVAMENYKNFNNGYPTSLPSTFVAGRNVNITVQSASASTYCLKGVEKEKTNVVYYVSNTSTTPRTGSC